MSDELKNFMAWKSQGFQLSIRKRGNVIMMQQYEESQKTTISRHVNFISAHRILDIQGNNLIIQLWPSDDSKTANILVSMPEEFSIGDYVDLQVIRHSKTSNSVELIGRTPQKFIPANGAAVAVS